MAATLLATALLSGCWSPGAPGPADGSAGQNATLAVQCARWNPVMLTHVMQAVACERGPGCGRVVGWMCGRAPQEVLVRIVFLGPADEESVSGVLLTPVVFEDGRLIGSGWGLLERQPDRYGVRILPPDEDWSAPPGWILVR
jgi:hypothetical protein